MLLRPQHAGFGKPKIVDNPQQKEYKEKGVINSGCSRHMTGNKCYLTEYEDYDGGFVSFRDGKGRISGKGKIKTGTLDFDNVYFCKELKYNLFSVSQICDKKNNVLFTDTECLVLSSDFKLLDESQVLLRVPRKDNIYSVDLKSVVPTKGLTCLFAKATIDESNLWHRRLGHINFKNMNKLVRGNLVRGLPSKIFENDHSCVACQKGKQHKASCKTKLVNSISKPLHMLHMDLFGPTNVKSLMKKSYCLVVTDDFSRFSWFWNNATSKTVNSVKQIHAIIDGKVVVISESSVRNDLSLMMRMEIGSGDRPKRQDTTLGGADAQTRPETASKMMELWVNGSNERKQNSHKPMKRRLFKGRVETSTDKSLGEDASKQERKIDDKIEELNLTDGVDTEVIREDKGSGERGELAQRLHEEELAELDRAQKERQKQEESTSVDLAEEFDEIQARIDVDHELAVRLTHEEHEKYTIKERELRDSMDVVPRGDVAIDVESLATKYPIIDWKTRILNENMMYYHIIRAYGSSKNYKIFSEMLDDFDKQDVIDLHRLVNERYEITSPEGYDLLLWEI
ncbi:putative ribonuclease H-like domain-containing protein [Tanacetum coccineum]